MARKPKNNGGAPGRGRRDAGPEPEVRAARAPEPPRVDLARDADVRRDARTGAPRKIRLEVPLPQSDAFGDEGGDSVRSFLAAHSGELGLPADEGSLRRTKDDVTPARRVIHYQQLHQGLPVVDTDVVVQLDNANRIRQIDLGHHPNPHVVEVAGDSALSPGEARQRAVSSLGAVKLRQEVQEPGEVFFPTDAGLRRSYLVLVPTRDPFHDWRILVDSGSGEILEQKDLAVSVDGAGLVFDPNPVVTANNNTFRDPAATPGTCGFPGTPVATVDGQRVSRTLRDITLNGNHRLEGPFVRLRDFGAPAIAPPQEAVAGNFNYSSGNTNFEAVMVYYHVDTVQRYIQSLGITTAHNSQIEADAHEGSGGAFFSPVDGGLHFGNSGNCRPNRASDADVILHEYGHAIQHDQVPGWGATSPVTGRAETRAMGEGFGDILACVFFAEHGGGFQREVFEDWIFSDAGGLRRVDGTKVYPTDWAFQEHEDGEIWSAALWNIYRAIGGDSVTPATRQAARDALLKTVILSHHLVPANGTLPDGAEALMTTDAELDEYRGRHLIEMLNSFHDRGILRSEPGVDLYIREAVGDPGNDAFAGPFWNSPDLWIRHSDDNGLAHQEPEFGQDNWFYARVHNRGTKTARAFVVTFNVKPWAGVEFVYPGDFIPFVSAAVGFDLAPGASTIVKAKWPKTLVPATGTHACWLASVYTPVDPVPAGRHVWEHNNLAQKNLTILDVIPGDTVTVPVQIGNSFRQIFEVQRLEVVRPRTWPNLPVTVTHRKPEVLQALFRSIEEAEPEPVRAQPAPVLRFLEPSRIEIAHRGMSAEPVRLSLGKDSRLDLGGVAVEEAPAAAAFGDAGREADLVNLAGGAAALAFRPGLLAGFPFRLKPRMSLKVDLKIQVPREARPGETLEVHLVQRNKRNQVVGGITVQLNVARRG